MDYKVFHLNYKIGHIYICTISQTHVTHLLLNHVEQ